MAAMEFLTSLAILLLIGIFLTYISRRLKIPNVVLLIVAGIVISLIRFKGEKIITFSNDFLTAIAIIALIMIVFDSTSRLRINSLGKEASHSLVVTTLFILTELVVISFATRFIFNFSWTISIIFASIMVGTDPSTVLVILKQIKHKTIDFLKIESIVNTPLTVILPFIVLEMAKTFDFSTFLPQFFQQLAPFLQQIITGVGAGMVVALIVFRAMRRQYSEILSPVTLIASALLTYILAEGLGGNGVLAITTLGIFFGNVYVKKKRTLQTFGGSLTNLFEILVFLLLGLSITLSTDYIFYLRASALFLIYLGVRAFVVFLSFIKTNHTVKEKLFISLNTSKGVAVAVIIFTLISLQVTNINLITDLCLLFIILSVVLSTLISRMSKFFLGVKTEEIK
ncbi:cation:proton antiporter [Nanoarchaeota archaeon]